MGSHYSPLSSTADDAHSTLSADEKGILRISNKWTRISFFAWLVTTLLWTFTILSFGLRSPLHATDAECGQRLSTYCKHTCLQYRRWIDLLLLNGKLLIDIVPALVIAPMMEAVEYETTQFENAFHQKSRYRGVPTPELEKAWLDLWNCEFERLEFHQYQEILD